MQQRIRSGAILLEPLLLDIGTDGLAAILPEGLQATFSDGPLLTDRSTCRMVHGAGCARVCRCPLPVE